MCIHIYIYIYVCTYIGGLKPPTLLDHLTLRSNTHDLRARPMIAKAKSPGSQLKSLALKM